MQHRGLVTNTDKTYMGDVDIIAKAWERKKSVGERRKQSSKSGFRDDLGGTWKIKGASVSEGMRTSGGEKRSKSHRGVFWIWFTLNYAERCKLKVIISCFITSGSGGILFSWMWFLQEFWNNLNLRFIYRGKFILMGFLHLGKWNNISLKLNFKSLRDGVLTLEEYPYSGIIGGFPWPPFLPALT